jgi:hypothetical protein
VPFRSLLALSLGLFSTFVAAAARAEDPAAPATVAAPPADLPPPSARTNLIIAGAATSVVSYGLVLGASYLFPEEELRGSKDLRLPFAGPWLALSKTGCPTSTPDCSKVTLVIGAILEVIDGVAQAGGLGVIGEGLFLNTSSARSAPRKAEAGPTARRYATAPTVRAVPFNFEKGGIGLGVVGTF